MSTQHLVLRDEDGVRRHSAVVIHVMLVKLRISSSTTVKKCVAEVLLLCSFRDFLMRVK